MSQSRRFGSVQSMGSNANSMVFARDSATPSSNRSEDPLQPLRTMADRVGKEVEKFAERVDTWYTDTNAKPTTRYETTLHLVHKFKDLADATVKELKKQNDAENKGELAKSIRRRIHNMADTPRPSIEIDAASIVTSGDSASASVRELRQWQAEAATWELARVIIEHYYPKPGIDAEPSKKNPIYRYSPNSEIWDRFILEDDQAKEKVLILKWLEQTAASTESDIDSITDQLEKESGQDTRNWTLGWLDTKSKIKQEKRLRQLAEPIGKGQPPIQSRDRSQILVSQLDPDAPTRQRRNLEKADDYGERALWLACYEMMRRGTSWKDIVEWCKNKNEAWRGVSIGAASEDQRQDHPNLSGPTVGYLWRRMCFYQARGARYQYESALYGLLSGDLKSVEPVCRSWDDHLYARYNALLLSRFDAFLQKKFPGKVSPTLARKFVFQDAAAAIGSWEDSSVHTIETLRQQKTTAALSAAPIKLIQGSLIGRRMEDLLINVGVAFSSMMRKDNRHVNLFVDPNEDDAPPGKEVEPKLPLGPEEEKYCLALASDPHALRIAVHLLIVLRNGLNLMDVPESGRAFAAIDNVIAGYIELLRVSRRLGLVPLYAAQLWSFRKYYCLGRVLPDIKNPHEQKLFVGSIESFGLSPEDAIAENYGTVLGASGLLSGHLMPVDRYEMLEKTSDEDLLWPGQRIKKDFFDPTVNAKERAVLDCMQWYSHLPKSRSATFVALTDAMKHFLLQGRVGAAVALAKDMSVQTVSSLKTAGYCGFSFDFTAEGAEHRDSQRGNWDKRGMISAKKHAQEVEIFRHLSESYYHMQQLATLIELFSQWREQEDLLLSADDKPSKPSVKKVKALFESIEGIVQSLLSGFLCRSSDGIPFTDLDEPPQADDEDATKRQNLQREYDEFRSIVVAYMPEVVLAYLCVVAAAGAFLSRDHLINGMEIANIVADDNNEWLRNAFRESGRMRELVTTLAALSQGMLIRVEGDPKAKSGKKKREWQGETPKIWDINVIN